VKQNKKAKIYAVFCFAGKKIIIYIYAVIVKQFFYKWSSNYFLSFICSCTKKIGAELYIYIEEATYHKRLFRGPSTNDLKKQDGPSLSWPTPHTTPFFLPPEDPYPVLLHPKSIIAYETCARPGWGTSLPGSLGGHPSMRSARPGGVVSNLSAPFR
jgi:hypothetical protein